jgi:hypothetical protein
MELIKPAGRILVEEMRQAIDRLRGCVIPIYDTNERQEAELLGSGVLINISENMFLCTAKHVVDRSASSGLYIAGSDKLEPLVGTFQSSQEHDVAILKLAPEQVSLLQRFSPLLTEYVASEAETQASAYVEFVGYPATKNRKVYNKNMLKNFIQANGCKVVSIDGWRVRIAFNEKKNIDSKTRGRVQAPDPHGMSGGGMFGVPMDQATILGRPVPKLIGISTDQPNSQEVFGATITIALAIIRDSWGTVLPERINPSLAKACETVGRP